MPLVECVPNISEGRNAAVVEAIVEAVRQSGAVHVLDVSSDASHNRSVLTLAAEPDAMAGAVLALFAAAIPRIDLRSHHGGHPRLGAVDVVPFVPLEGTTMAACVALARTTAAAVAATFGVPVFLYEQAARDPSRRNLADIRRGEFEGLAAKMTAPAWTPDFGPARPHPTAGAAVVGARMPLVAFNVNLSTTELALARRIAASVRESSGGLPRVKAMGVALADRGLVQVSMNLTDYTVTPLDAAFAAVRSAAAANGVAVLEAEIVGLVPAAAVPPEVRAAIPLPHFSPDQILERRLAAAGS